MKKILQVFILVGVVGLSTIAHSGCDSEYDNYYKAAEKLYNFSHQAIAAMAKNPGTFNLESGDYLVYELISVQKAFDLCLKNNKLWSITSVAKGPKMRKMAKKSAAEHEKAKAMYLSQK